MARDLTDARRKAERTVFALCRHIGLTERERHDLAAMVVGVASMRSMDDDSVRLLIDHLNGFVLVTHLIRQRPPVRRPTPTTP